MVTLCYLAGCGGNGKPQGSVHGTVTFQGQPVTQGTVLLFSRKTGQNFAGPVGTDGRFTITDAVDAGDYVAMVQPPMATAAPGSPEVSKPKEYANIPRKYHSDTTSNLTAVVKTGKNDIKLELLP
ncbi:MAG: hypothetical protein V4719_20940 [Planctomycetota bacterium]